MMLRLRWRQASVAARVTALAGAAAVLLTGTLLSGTVSGGTTPAGPALAGAALAGAMLTALLLLTRRAARVALTREVLPLLRPDLALRTKSWQAAFLRITDPDAPGHSRPRAPAAA